VSEFTQIRADFNRAVVRGAWTRSEDVVGDWPISPEKWLQRFYRPVELDLTRQRRLINHFSVGADPEFVFEQVDALGGRARVDANTQGMKAGLAFGADNNGRLVEIRPRPSRFVLETLASTWSTLKWMALLCPATVKYHWRAGAFYANDGLGGHIHFGRRRPQKSREVAALDTLAFWLYHSNVWDQAEGRRRIREAQGGGNHGYGRLGDKRDQPYGYEYRTFPSWLCSPWMSYLPMVLAKLAVFDPMLFPLLEESMEKETPVLIRARLGAILAYYKGRDDDAALAHAVLSRQGFPRWEVCDLKEAWGIPKTADLLGKAKIQVLPTSIPPLDSEVKELLQALLQGRAPLIPSLKPSWTPTELPTGYIPAIQEVNTRHAPGLGELIADLCYSSDLEWHTTFLTHGGNGLALPRTLLGKLRPWAGVCAELAPWVVGNHQLFAENGQPFIQLGVNTRQNDRREDVRKFLLSGILPIWRVSEVRANSLEEWKKKWLRPEVAKGKFQFSKEIK